MYLFSVWSATEGGYLWFVLCTGRFLQHRTRRVYTYSIHEWTTPLCITSPLFISFFLSFWLSFSIHIIYIIHVCVYFITRWSLALYIILSHAIVCMNAPCLHASLGPFSPACTHAHELSSSPWLFLCIIYNTYDLSAAGAVAVALQCPPRVFAATL